MLTAIDVALVVSDWVFEPLGLGFNQYPMVKAVCLSPDDARQCVGLQLTVLVRCWKSDMLQCNISRTTHSLLRPYSIRIWLKLSLLTAVAEVELFLPRRTALKTQLLL